MTDRQTITKQITDGLLHCLTHTPWDDITLSVVADQADIALVDMAGFIDADDDLLNALMRRGDREMIQASGPFMAQDTAQDRLFDIIMARIDCLQANRDAYINLFNTLRRRPLTALSQLSPLTTSLNWMLQIAEIKVGGVKGHLQRLALARVYVQTLHAWQADESPDMGKTMAKLNDLLAGSMRFIQPHPTKTEQVDWTSI